MSMFERTETVAGEVLALQAAIAALIAMQPDPKIFREYLEHAIQGLLAQLENTCASTEMIAGYQHMAENLRNVPSARGVS